MTDQATILAHVRRDGAESAIRKYGWTAVQSAGQADAMRPAPPAGDMPRPEITLDWRVWTKTTTDPHVYWVANLTHAGFDVEVTVQRDDDGCTCRGDDIACLDNHPVVVVAADVSLAGVELAHQGVGSVAGESYDRPGADANAAAVQMVDEAAADARSLCRSLVEAMSDRGVL